MSKIQFGRKYKYVKNENYDELLKLLGNDVNKLHLRANI